MRSFCPTPKPKARRKDLGFYCKKCDDKRRLDMRHLCTCLEMVEDMRDINRHIRREWLPIYAEVRFKI